MLRAMLRAMLRPKPLKTLDFLRLCNIATFISIDFENREN
nr:MAG TPA: hypothetical protein [Caudoviricetes sp.]DAL48698.1 MAG TPA_asm: hypothetical protein [Caudoviricetes sp.]